MEAVLRGMTTGIEAWERKRPCSQEPLPLLPAGRLIPFACARRLDMRQPLQTGISAIIVCQNDC